MASAYLLTGSSLIILWLLRLVVQRVRRRTLKHLPGPVPRNWLIGNWPDLVRPAEVGEAEWGWMKQYGTAIRLPITLGREMLFLSDPKAIQYVLNTSGYHFHKPNSNRMGLELLLGRGLVWADGTQHSRQRKIMNPAFSFAALRGFLPLFTRTAQRAVVKIKDIVGENGAVTDVLPWLSRTTLDALGEAAFGYEFHAVEKGNGSKLAAAYNGLLTEAFSDRSDIALAIEALLGLLPSWAIGFIRNIPAGQFKVLKNYMIVATEIAEEIIDKQTTLYADGKEGSKDVMSILVRANLSQDPKLKLTNDEIKPQLTTLFLAGHDTTAITASWVLHRLSLNKEYQTVVRDEIKAAQAASQARGEELTIADLESMKFLVAAMKETLRFDSIILGIIREAERDDVIPLSIPQKTMDGDTITSIPISPGQRVMMSFNSYNRLPEVWGPDADTWNPMRFINGIQSTQKTTLGVISNVATFSSGVRGCIGWRFALLEMQAILIELLDNFEFSPAPGNIEIFRGSAGMMTPMVKGTEKKKSQLPLTVTPLR